MDVCNMSNQKIYTLPEAKSLIPWLMEASKEAEQRVRKAQLDAKGNNDAQAKIQAIIRHWTETIAKLGGLPKQPFTVDFDSGRDFFCWEYPEDDIYFRHDYDRGYAGRHPIKENDT